MAYAFVGAVLDNRRTKIFDFSFLDNDAAGNQVIGYVAAGMTVLEAAPDDVKLEIIGSPDTANTGFIVSAMDANGITVRKLTAGGGANAVTVRAVVRCGHSINL